MEFDYKTIEDSFRKLPEQAQNMLVSTDIAGVVKKIGGEFGLRVDQLDALFDHTSFVLLGLTKSNDFVNNFSKEAQVDEKTARDIAQEINKEVFEKIKSSMKQNETIAANNSLSSLERAGNFEIIKEQPMKEPLVDQLLSTGATIPPAKTVITPENKPAQTQTPRPPQTNRLNDPYREQFK